MKIMLVSRVIFFDCWLMSSGVTLDILQDKQMLYDFVGTKRGGICGIMGDIYIHIYIYIYIYIYL